jgi:hypothetical protein
MIRCGVSCSLEKAQEAAGTTLIAGHAPSARVESARLAVSSALEPAYARTGQVWQARSAKDGVITWEPGDTGLAPQPEPQSGWQYANRTTASFRPPSEEVRPHAHVRTVGDRAVPTRVDRPLHRERGAVGQELPR